MKKALVALVAAAVLAGTPASALAHPAKRPHCRISIFVQGGKVICIGKHQ